MLPLFLEILAPSSGSEVFHLLTCSADLKLALSRRTQRAPAVHVWGIQLGLRQTQALILGVASPVEETDWPHTTAVHNGGGQAGGGVTDRAGLGTTWSSLQWCTSPQLPWRLLLPPCSSHPLLSPKAQPFQVGPVYSSLPPGPLDLQMQ